MKPFKKFNIKNNKDLYELQNNCDEVFQSLIPANALLSYVLKKEVALGNYDTVVNHGLDRDYQGYLVVNRNANAVVYTSPTVNNNKSRQIILNASATVTVTLLIF